MQLSLLSPAPIDNTVSDKVEMGHTLHESHKFHPTEKQHLIRLAIWRLLTHDPGLGGF